MEMGGFGLRSKIFIVSILVLFVFLTLFLLFSSSSKNKKTPGTVLVPTQVSSNSQPNSAISSTWVTQNAQTYNISYPNNWTAQTVPAQGRESYLSISPNTATEADVFPTFAFQVYLLQDMTLAQRLSDLSPLNLNQSYITFHGFKATQLQGILPLKFLTGNPQNKPVMKTYIMLENNGRLYVFDYAYYVDADAEKNKSVLMHMLDTINIY